MPDREIIHASVCSNVTALNGHRGMKPGDVQIASGRLLITVFLRSDNKATEMLDAMTFTAGVGISNTVLASAKGIQIGGTDICVARWE